MFVQTEQKTTEWLTYCINQPTERKDHHEMRKSSIKWKDKKKRRGKKDGEKDKVQKADGRGLFQS